MDRTLSITLFKQVLMCLMKLHSTTRRWGGGGSILIIKGGGRRERDVNRGTKVAGFCCKAANIAATCSCDEKVLTPSTTVSLCVSALQAATVGTAAAAGLK